MSKQCLEGGEHPQGGGVKSVECKPRTLIHAWPSGEMSDALEQTIMPPRY